MACDATPIFPHESREGGFPYMSASTYFPLQHQCWHYRAAFVQPAGLVLMLPPGPGNKPMQSPNNQIWFLSLLGSPLLKTLVVDLPSPALLVSAQASFHLYPGPGLLVQAWPWVGSPCPEIMGIQGMELFAIGVVIILFMAVLKQFGILEPMSSFEGKGPPEAPLLAVLMMTHHFNPLHLLYKHYTYLKNAL